MDEQPVCFVCGKQRRKNAKKKYLGLMGNFGHRSFCKKKHLNKYWKNEKKYEERSRN